MNEFTTMDEVVFGTLGVVAHIQRPPGLPKAVQVVVRDGVERFGEFQQVIGRARHVLARNREWMFRRGDEVILDGRVQSVEGLVRDDGLVNEAALHG